MAEQARAHYQRAMQAQREGNWALYGEEIKKLGEVLEKMRIGAELGDGRVCAIVVQNVTCSAMPKRPEIGSFSHNRVGDWFARG